MASILDGVDQRTQMAGQNRLELLLFRLQGRKQRFGINVFKVQEVIQCPPLTAVPQSHAVVRGIANMRGKTIPILDLSMAIGGPHSGEYNGKFVIITEYNTKVQGFLVDSVDRIINMNWDQILPPPKGTTSGSYMTAVTQIDDELVQIIDVEKVLSEVVGFKEEVSEGIIDDSIQKDENQHILVADDSSMARNQIKRVLDQMGVQYTVCNDGAAALEQLREWRDEGKDLSKFLALVISDIEMPKMDGYSLTKAIREDPAMENLYVILHTSMSGVFNESMVAKVGANEFQPKWDPDHLAEKVQERLMVHAEKN